MNAYKLLSGETIKYGELPPHVGAYLNVVKLAAADPAANTRRMIELVYSPNNPVLDSRMLPGRGMVTDAVAADPVYRIMADLIGVKQVQLGELDLAAAEAPYSIPVEEAARQLGIAPEDVVAAIESRRMSAHLRDGEWFTRAESIASYRLVLGNTEVAAAVGNEKGRSMGIRVEGGQFVRTKKKAHVMEGHLSPGWSRAIIRSTAEGGSVRVWIIQPAAKESEIVHGAFFVRGPFNVVERINNAKKANVAWKSISEQQLSPAV